MKALHAIAFILTIIGGLNWGVVGIGELANAQLKWNVVNMLLGSWPTVEAIVYVLVGLSALYLVFTHKRDCKNCEPKASM